MLFLSVIILITGCKEPKYKGFTSSESGLRYKFHVIGSGKESPKKGNTVRLQSSDTLLSFELKNTNDGGLQEAASMLAIGDSASFIINQEPISLQLTHILTKQEVENEQQLKDYFAKQENLTKEAVDTILKQPDLYQFTFKKGLWQKTIKDGVGSFPKTDQKVWVHYSGYFTNGKGFDSTKKRKEAYELTLGQPDQVIQGLEAAIRQLREGGKAKFIIPSQLAFGANGSSTGIVPSNSIVIYEVELIKINQ